MEALKLFQEYMGTGLIMIWFLVSLLYLWVTEKRKHIRILFVYVPLVLLVDLLQSVGCEDHIRTGGWRNLLPDSVASAGDTGRCIHCGQSLWKAEWYLKYVGITVALILFILSGSLSTAIPIFKKQRMSIMYPRV